MMKHKINDILTRYSISNVTDNSKKLLKNSAFFAIKGSKSDGNQYIEEAFSNGASVVFTDCLELAGGRVEYVENARLGLALAAGIIYPDLPAKLIAVTGTNGKSSVVFYVYQLLALLGQKVAAMGTTGINLTEENIVNEVLNISSDSSSALTTMQPVYFRQILNYLAKSEVKYVVFEASSHGLEQNRLGDISVNAAAFVSFSQDHLEYHGTMQAYLKAKLSLFEKYLSKDAKVVLSSELDFFQDIEEFLQKNQINHQLVGKKADIKIIHNNYSDREQEIEFSHLNKKYKFRTKIIGSFQATNLLIALKLVHNLGFPFAKLVKLLPQLQPVIGRLQCLTKETAQYQIFVDYAHTPDALRKSLQELKAIKKKTGKLYIIFGCGGDRDQTKRSMMGDIAVQIADEVIITDDNPRFEDPEIIREQIMQNIKYSATEIADREEAIKQVIAKLNIDDILLIAGKGHETYQVIKDKIINFSDIEIVKKYMEK